jgi:hypothetical protein
MAVRAFSRAMETAKAIAESDKIPDERKSELTQQVFQAANAQGLTDKWAQRLVPGGLALIGIIVAVFVGVAVLERIKIDSAVTSALTATIGGLAGMFTQKAIGGGGAQGAPGAAQDSGTQHDGSPAQGGGQQRPPAKRTTVR